MVLDDACQGFGGVYKGKTIGSIGDASATSFFPAKPLGCYGDGGAVFTDDSELYEKMTSIRVHGKGDNKYHNVRLGLNARMDTIQAAVLLEKLKIFPNELEARNKVAKIYNDAFEGLAITPSVPDGYSSSWAQYTLCVEAEKRAMIMVELKNHGIPSVIYYPIPLHKQPGYARYPTATEILPVSEGLCKRVFSLPMHPYLDGPVQEKIIDAVRAIL